MIVNVGSGGGSIPVGTVEMYAGSTAPDGWLLCQGQSLSKTTYAELFEVIGYTYGGSGDSFKLPNTQGRTIVGAGTESSVTYDVGGSGGSKDAIVPYHRHSVDAFNTGGPDPTTTASDGSHKHTIQLDGHDNVYAPAPSGALFTPMYTQAGTGSYHTETDGSHSHSLNSHKHSVGAHNTNYAGSNGNTNNANMMPYLVFNYIIYAGV